MLPGERHGQLGRALQALKRLLERPLDDGTYLPVMTEVMTKGAVVGTVP
jgi:hypothetical protein